MTAETAECDVSSWDDPFDMEMSGVGAREGLFFLPGEARSLLGSAGVEVDISLLDGAIDQDAQTFSVQQVSIFSERRTWPSLAVVLLFHAILACLFPISGKPPAGNPKIIEARLVLPAECQDQAGWRSTQREAPEKAQKPSAPLLLSQYPPLAPR